MSCDDFIQLLSSWGQGNTNTEKTNRPEGKEQSRARLRSPALGAPAAGRQLLLLSTPKWFMATVLLVWPAGPANHTSQCLHTPSALPDLLKDRFVSVQSGVAAAWGAEKTPTATRRCPISHRLEQKREIWDRNPRGIQITFAFLQSPLAVRTSAFQRQFNTQTKGCQPSRSEFVGSLHPSQRLSAIQELICGIFTSKPKAVNHPGMNLWDL